MSTSLIQVNGDNFWSSDLDEIESVFLDQDKKITDLPTVLNNKVPPQGSVLLGRIVNIDDVVDKPSLLERWLRSAL